MEPWGYITCIDASGCHPERITDVNLFQSFVDDLLEKIEMVPIGPLNINWCDTHDPKKRGHSIYQILQDSNISIHFCPEDNCMAFCDIFSCKPYSDELVVELFSKAFLPTNLEFKTIARNRV